MNTKNKHLCDEKTLEFCRHARMLSNVDRIYIIEVINEYQKCRVNQIVMETGLSIRQVYYQLSVLRRLDYITTKYDKGRYLVYPGFGMYKGEKLLGVLTKMKNVEEKQTVVQTERSHLRIVR